MPGNLHTLRPITPGDSRGGRKPGQTNIATRLMKRALILAAERSDHSKDGTLVSYVTWIANDHPALFCSMLGRMVPVEAKIKTENFVPRLDPNAPLDAMISAFEMKIKSDYRPPHTIEHEADDDDDE